MLPVIEPVVAVFSLVGNAAVQGVSAGALAAVVEAAEPDAAIHDVDLIFFSNALCTVTSRSLAVWLGAAAVKVWEIFMTDRSN